MGKAREWQYWTINKLQILSDYLPAFNRASTKSAERVYLDLMAGQPENVEAGTKELFDGSVRRAMSADPGFTRLAFIEADDRKAQSLADDLAQGFPGDSRGRVYSGDCNVVIDSVLHDLDSVRWAPTFAFLDQQGAEISWETIEKVARFRRGKTKVELWTLLSPAMIVKGIKGSGGDGFARRVDRLYGSDDWRRFIRAQEAGLLDAEGVRREMVNLFRWLLEDRLGYKVTVRVPMRMKNSVAIYDMVFATDHPVGLKIMADLYAKAVQREPQMQAEVRARELNEVGGDTLFDVPVDMVQTEATTWVNEPAWNPYETDWFRS